LAVGPTGSKVGCWDRPSTGSIELGVFVVSDVLLIVSGFLFAALIASILVRAVSAKLLQARQERLKANLDWINPIPQTSRKRGLTRR
jgi:flagellar biosynthesis protein FlhB